VSQDKSKAEPGRREHKHIGSTGLVDDERPGAPRDFCLLIPERVALKVSARPPP